MEINELIDLLTNSRTPEPCIFEVGEAYLIRTVTMTQIGIIKRVVGNFIELAEASWVADTGRFYDALAKGSLNEVEPMPQGCIVHLGAIVDASPWVHALPTKQK